MGEGVNQKRGGGGKNDTFVLRMHCDVRYWKVVLHQNNLNGELNHWWGRGVEGDKRERVYYQGKAGGVSLTFSFRRNKRCRIIINDKWAEATRGVWGDRIRSWRSKRRWSRSWIVKTQEDIGREQEAEEEIGNCTGEAGEGRGAKVRRILRERWRT